MARTDDPVFREVVVDYVTTEWSRRVRSPEFESLLSDLADEWAEPRMVVQSAPVDFEYRRGPIEHYGLASE